MVRCRPLADRAGAQGVTANFKPRPARALPPVPPRWWPAQRTTGRNHHAQPLYEGALRGRGISRCHRVPRPRGGRRRERNRKAARHQERDDGLRRPLLRPLQQAARHHRAGGVHPERRRGRQRQCHQPAPGRQRQGERGLQAGFVGFLGQFCPNDGGNGQIPATSYACINYPPFWDVFQAKFAPDSNESGLCVGVTGAASASESSLVSCRGVTGHTFWVGDAANGLGGDCRVPGNYCPWVNGADQSTADPLALTLNGSSRHPANVLRSTRRSSAARLCTTASSSPRIPGPAS